MKNKNGRVLKERKAALNLHQTLKPFPRFHAQKAFAIASPERMSMFEGLISGIAIYVSVTIMLSLLRHQMHLIHGTLLSAATLWFGILVLVNSYWSSDGLKTPSSPLRLLSAASIAMTVLAFMLGNEHDLKGTIFLGVGLIDGVMLALLIVKMKRSRLTHIHGQ